MRDLDAKPYTDDEKRVGEYISKITNDAVGWGDDPIGFLIAAHAYLVWQRDDLAKTLEKLASLSRSGASIG